MSPLRPLLARAALLLAPLLLAPPARAEAPARELTAAWYGETLTHPGLQLGVDQRLVDLGPLRLLGSAEAGGYLHYRYALGLFTDLGLGLRYTTGFGMRIEARGGLGGLYQRPHGPVYAVSDAGAVSEARGTGRVALRPSVSLGLGQEFGQDRPKAVFLRVQRFGERPVHGGAVPHLALLAGLALPLP